MKEKIIINLQDSHEKLYGYSNLGVWAKNESELNNKVKNISTTSFIKESLPGGDENRLKDRKEKR